MPCCYVIDKKRRLIISTYSGRVTQAEIETSKDQFTHDPDFDPRFSQFVDMTAVVDLDISTDQAKTIAQRKVFSPASRRAFLARDPAVYGMYRLMEAYHSMAKGEEQVYVFYDRKEALKWLGLEALPDPNQPKGTKSEEAADPAKSEELG